MAKRVAAMSLGLVVATSMTCGLGQPASAANLKNVLRDVLQKGAKNFLGSSQGPSQATIQNNINVGLANVDSSISTEQAGRQLTDGEAAQLRELRVEADKLKAMNATFLADGTYSNDEVSQFLAAMQNFNKLHASVLANHVPQYPAVVTKAHPNVSGKAQTNVSASNWSKVTSLQTTVKNRINAGLVDGSLTAAEAAQFHSQLNSINRELNASRQSMGNINTNPLFGKLRDLNKRVAQLSSSRLN